MRLSIQTPIFAYSRGQFSIFETPHCAVNYLEPYDLKYDEIYDALGGLLQWKTAGIMAGQYIEFTGIDYSPVDKVLFRLRLIEALLYTPSLNIEPEMLLSESLDALKNRNIEAYGLIR